ncbi:carboxypeptidase regulatory-like domain-containing protein [Nocardioides sp.]|uniref:carboxypeptidase regulatory-like domain-containing protein n=1 Tax=Nocardioides sp. TaxID=35761 RepID=UPI0035B3639D
MRDLLELKQHPVLLARRTAGVVLALVAGLFVTAAPAHAADGLVTGTILTDTGAQANHLHVDAYTLTGNRVRSEIFDNGTYQLSVPAGQYKICFSNHNSWQTFCAGGGVIPSQGSTVTVGAGGTTVVDGRAPARGTLTGHLTEPGGQDAADATVKALVFDSVAGKWVGVRNARTNASGNYTLRVPQGTYRIRFGGTGVKYGTVFYPNAATPEAATDVTMPAGLTLGGINGTVTLASSISGTVTAPAAGLTSNDRRINVVNLSTGAVRTAWTRVSGPSMGYTVYGLSAGTYRVSFARVSGAAFGQAQFYQGKPESLGAGSATVVTVGPDEQVGGIDATLVDGGTIRGTLVDPDGAPLRGCRLQALTTDHSLVTRAARSQSDGSFSIGGLSTGSYRVRVVPNRWQGDCHGQVRFHTATNGTMTPDDTQSVDVAVQVGAASQVGTQTYATTPAVRVLTRPSIGGNPVVGSTLSVQGGTWAPSDAALAYEWRDEDTGALRGSQATYQAQAADAGRWIELVITGTKSGYLPYRAYVGSVRISAAPPPPPPVVPPTTPTVTPPPVPPVVPAPATIAVKKAAVSGTAKVGQVLKAKPGKVSVPGVKVTYTWYAGSKAIKKATKASLKLTSKLKGKKVSVRITYTKAGYTTLVKTIKVGKVK